LSIEALERLLRYLPPHAARAVHFAYLTGMRAGEIFNLTWDKVDLAQELVRFGAEDMKTSGPRVVFLCGRAYDILKIDGGSDPWITTESSHIGETPSRRSRRLFLMPA
jgi:integrase